MYFSNLMGDISKKYSRWGSMPITFVDSDGVSTKSVKVVLTEEGNKELLLTDGEGTNVFAMSGNESEKFYADKSDLTFGDIADTEDNPLIVVCTKGVRFFYNIPTYIRTLFINDDMMLIELIYGACEFQFADGTFVALQRCNDDNLADRELTDVLKCERLSEMFSFNTPGGYNKAFCSIVPVYVEPVSTKKSTHVGYLCDKDKVIIFDEDSIKERLQKEADREKKRLEKEKMKAEKAKLVAEAEEHRRQKEYEDAQKKLAAQAEIARKKAESYVSKSDKMDRNTGAEAFLAMLNGG